MRAAQAMGRSRSARSTPSSAAVRLYAGRYGSPAYALLVRRGRGPIGEPRGVPRGVGLTRAGVVPLGLPQEHRAIVGRASRRCSPGSRAWRGTRRASRDRASAEASVASISARMRSTAASAVGAALDRLVEPAAAHLVDDIEHGAVAREDVPLEDPHHGRRLEADREDAPVGEGPDVEPLGDGRAGVGHGPADGLDGGGVVGEPSARPVGGDRMPDRRRGRGPDARRARCSARRAARTRPSSSSDSGPARHGPPSCVQVQMPSTCGFAARKRCSASW